MYLDLSDEQKMLAQTVRGFVQKELLSDKVRQIMETEDAFDEQLWQKMAEQGWMSLTVPVEFGGLAESWLTVAVLFEELGRGMMPGPFLATVGLAAPLLTMVGSAEQKARWLPAIVEGKCRASVAYMEPDASYELDAISTTASEVSGKYTLSGTKMFALDAGVSDIIIVAAKEEGKLGLFLVEKGAEGLTVEILEGMDLSRRLTRIILKNTQVEKIDAFDDHGQALVEALNCASFALSVERVVGMHCLLDTAVDTGAS